MIKVLFAPLQGYTDAIYRRLHNKHFGGINKYYAPYLRFEPNKEPKNSVINDLLPNNNKDINLIPQLLGNDITLFIEHTKKLQEQGYTSVNWNLACPYPMVYKRGFGSGLLKSPETINELLSEIIPNIEIPLSIKCRLGFDSKNEINELINIFNNHELQEIIIHARTAKQMYKGSASPKYFNSVLSKSKNKIIYNGDINTIANYNTLSEILGHKPDKIMIGRGLLQNPFLANELNGIQYEAEHKLKTLREFHDDILYHYNEKLEKSHILKKMQTFWEYFSYNFENQPKVYKKIKKAVNMQKYEEKVLEIFG